MSQHPAVRQQLCASFLTARTRLLPSLTIDLLPKHSKATSGSRWYWSAWQGWFANVAQQLNTYEFVDAADLPMLKHS
jgi:hypothetical protein